MNMTKKLDFKKYFANPLTNNPLNSNPGYDPSEKSPRSSNLTLHAASIARKKDADAYFNQSPDENYTSRQSGQKRKSTSKN